MGFAEFVAVIAAIQASVALAIDMMVPALGQMATALSLGGGNTRQWVITSFVLGFGAAQLLYAAVADSFPRRRVLLASLALYALGSFAAACAPSFGLLLAARLLQGLGAAGAQVLSVSVVRDCYAGRLMAQVNSLSFMVFLAAPIFAPGLGQALLIIAPWQGIFIALGLYGLAVAAWVAWRLPETQHAGDRHAIAWAPTLAALRLTLSTRVSLGYTLTFMLLLGAWLGFINSAQQVFAGVFGVPKLFPAIFAVCSVSMAAAALLNARLVERLGMRRLAHGALAGFIAVALAQAGLALSGAHSLLAFALLQSAMMFGFGLFAGNCGAIAMEPLGHVAGTAAAVQGCLNTFGAALIGLFIGQSFNGTLVPLTLGFAVCGVAGLAVAAVTERGVLFRKSALITSV
jgi:DHA1 family bicyclomycin/chloramphenicol resistance-like MFS transporter